jgi:RNA polymerase sigma-70 factor (ECF subfamily)
MAERGPGVEEAFRKDRGYLWALAYRLTGCAADADDVVQETFVRAMTRPPARADLPLRPWLVRVALNLGRDVLRARRRHAYPGVWLPSPVSTDDTEPPAFDPPAAGGSPHARYDLLESVSIAFLVALEALTPNQRAVLLLRDVLDYSVKEAAAALRMTEANVKTTHLRARRAMAAYDGDRQAPRTRPGTAEHLGRFLACLVEGDAAGLAALLAEDVVAQGDGGGVYAAAPRPLLGRDAVLRLYQGVAGRVSERTRVELRTLNGQAALVVMTDDAPRGWPPASVLFVDVDAAGRIRRIYSMLAPRKLTAVKGLAA